MKKIFFFATMILLVVSLVACTAQDEFANFNRATIDEIKTINRFEVIDDTNLDDQTLSQLSFDNIQSLSMTTLDVASMTNLEKIAYIRTLYHDIQTFHKENLLIRTEIKDIWVELKMNVAEFRATELSLSEDDQFILLNYQTEFSIRRLEIKDSIGSIKTSLETLKGHYDLDHLDLIIEHFESILNVLVMRNTHMIDLNQALLEVNQIALKYIS